MLTEEMKQMVTDSRLGYVATSTKKGVSNVSPKGSIRVVDDNTLAFACIWLEKTAYNLEENPHIAVAVLDTTGRKGFQAKGTATLETSGPLFDEMAAEVAKTKLPGVKSIARITVTEVYPIPPGG
jgi:predicted pyridoxine 5'-phosphate oxidase superfamily flavin-nucleotide-binding protein